MKIIANILVATLAFGLMSCEKFPVIKIDLTSETTFDINKNSLEYSDSKLLDPTTNEDFNKRSGKINEVTISKVTYTITDFQGSDTQVANATYSVADENGNNPQIIGSFTNINLSSEVGNENDLTLNPAGTAALGNYFANSPFKAVVSYNATVNETPVRFKVKIKFYFETKARLIGNND